MSNPSGPPAGWYDHPAMANTQRYWDGSRWTDQIAPKSTPAYVPPRTYDDHEQPTGLIAGGYITALLLPLVGFIIGIVLLAKKEPAHGIACMILAILAFFFWMDALASQADPYEYGYLITFRY